MREAHIYKNRECRNCHQSRWTTAFEIGAHERMCRRMNEAGLIVPAQDDRKKIIIPTEKERRGGYEVIKL